MLGEDRLDNLEKILPPLFLKSFQVSSRKTVLDERCQEDIEIIIKRYYQNVYRSSFFLLYISPPKLTASNFLRSDTCRNSLFSLSREKRKKTCSFAQESYPRIASREERGELLVQTEVWEGGRVQRSAPWKRILWRRTTNIETK